MDWAMDVTNSTLNHHKVQALMSSLETFDVYLYEIFINDALIGLGHYFNASVIGFSTLGTTRWVQEYTGTPIPSSYLAHFLLGFSDKMNFIERFINFFMNLYEETIFPIYFYPKMTEIYDKSFPNPKPTFDRARKSAMSLALLNTHSSMRGAQSLMTNVIECGGMHLKRDTDSLPRDLQIFLDNATEGAVYFSLGSNIKPSHLGDVRKNAIINVLSQFKPKVIWNWDDVSAGTVNPDKFYTSKWLPQNEILAHDNTKLFITHGGLLSLTEAVFYGVPVVGFAIFADQKYNLVKAVEQGYGQLIDFSNVTETSLAWAVNEILSNQNYETSAKMISKRFKDRPMNGLQTAKYWIEYVIRNNGAKFLQSPALELNILQYYSLDVIIVVIILIYLVIILIKTGLAVVFDKFIRTRSKPQQNLIKKVQ